MKNPFERDDYKFGAESFLIMFLNQYQFILGSDLENYINNDNLFNEKENPCNIYFILRRPKVTINPESVVIKGQEVSFELIIHNKDQKEIILMGLKFPEAKSTLVFNSQYPYNLFSFSDGKDFLFVARPGSLIDYDIAENEYDIPSLDYEIMYIGQSYGKDGKRTALTRLSSHETLQKIYTHTSSEHPNSDIWIMLTNFSQKSMLMTTGADFLKPNQENELDEYQKVSHFFKNNGLYFSEKQKINFTEAALIKYFKPKYNIEFKDSFPNPKHKSYSECYKLNVRAITIEINTDEMKRKIYTKSSEKKVKHMKMFEFNSDEDRISLLGMNDL
ncbi:hypothetical protein [Ochrovirga pacifica]|uniref:hypothetical protein n=1 Tax=Ochrovirga pacifica TaxID=1042376 RepID=UPI000255A24C|nr:hypothetical protein [Ochrovirga pacifica]